MFFDEIEKNGIKMPRFQYIGEEVPADLAAGYSPLSKLK
jgi:hypothetical protein